ncbi:hypothetical protein H6P81_014185 [Aristolochia fimbriata]|uniref:VQ domain-containing protein n=1 Tax=Aristolochia fimbriata TaxID=158543 RepID=A0AAV7EGU9_ARIFI|nr:hypothetical protein H6P81_014185 [Aristolochia fimbriata]
MDGPLDVAMSSSSILANDKKKEPVKVKIIMTQYVETDALSFKSVVQGLTGFNSGAYHEAENRAEAARRVQKEEEKRKRKQVSFVEGYNYDLPLVDWDIAYMHVHAYLIMKSIFITLGHAGVS